jgi:hypothetical protein
VITLAADTVFPPAITSSIARTTLPVERVSDAPGGAGPVRGSSDIPRMDGLAIPLPTVIRQWFGPEPGDENLKRGMLGQ